MSNNWNWKEKRTRKAFLALEDGSIFRGYTVGAAKDSLGEVVFNTGLSGYEEILSDPSYSGQFVVMTPPEIGNIGINRPDMESAKFYAAGFVMREMNAPSNWRSHESLSDSLARQGIPAIAGIDTRALTLLLRERGTQKGYLSVEGSVSEQDAVAKAKAWEGIDNQDYASQVTCAAPYEWDPTGELTCGYGTAPTLPPADLHVVAYDFGIKWNILRCMRLAGMKVTVVPAKTTAEEVLALKPDGVFLSNGPGDPAAVTYAVENTRKLIGKVPMMGICLGHQIIGLACGAKTERLKFGHHGCNHPIKDLKTGAVEITSQNHNYAVDESSLDSSVATVTHLNLNDGSVEGMELVNAKVFSVQSHPESAPGPHDSRGLFARFRHIMQA